MPEPAALHSSPAHPPRAPAAPLRHALRALRHRNFLLFWVGQGTSVFGTWMQTTAQGWLLFRLTHSPMALGLLSAARFGPALVAAPFAGLLSDRFPRRRVALFTQAAGLLLATLLAELALTGRVRVPHILLLATLQGFADAVDATNRYAFQRDLVPADDLQSALGLNSAAFNVARMMGPWVAGILIARLGEAVCFGLNAASYLAVLGSLLLIRLPPGAYSRPSPAKAQALLAGLRFTFSNPAIRRVMLVVALTSLTGLAFNTLVPALAGDVLHTGPRGFSWLLAGGGIGAVLGSLGAAAYATPGRTACIHGVALCALGCALLTLAVARAIPLALAGMMLLGAMTSVQHSTSNAFLQSAAPADLRGRVASLYVWVMQGLAPVGGLLLGWAASRVGIPITLAWTGSVGLAAGITLSFRLSRHPRQVPSPG
jgi:MFS family permease